MTKVTCPNCGHSIPLSNYCILCGKKMENIRTCKKCNTLYLKQLQTCPSCFTPINDFTPSRYISWLMYFQSMLSIVFLLSSYFIIQMVLGFCFFLFIPELNKVDTIISDTANLMIIILSNLFFIIILTKFSPYRFDIQKNQGKSRLTKFWIILGVFVISISFLELSLTFFNQFFDQLSLPPSFSSPYDSYLENPINTIIFCFLVVIIGPIFEELVFRRHICLFFESTISSKNFIIFLSGIIFSLNHLSADLLNGSIRFTIEHLYVVFILGIVLGVIYYQYGLFFSIIFHSLWNIFSFIIQIDILSPDSVLLSNVLLILGLFTVIILPGVIVYRNREKVRNIKNYKMIPLTSRKLSLPVFINAASIIIYELLITLLLIANQNAVSMFLLLGVHTLGIVLGFIVLDTDLKKNTLYQEQ